MVLLDFVIYNTWSMRLIWNEFLDLNSKSKAKRGKSQTFSAARKAANLDKFLNEMDTAKPHKKYDG